MDTPTEAKEIQTEFFNRQSGGEVDDRAEILKIRNLIQNETDVHEVMALSWLPHEGRWLYLIKTPFATWPKYVVGTTDSTNEDVEILLRCGLAHNAVARFDELNMGWHV